MAQSHQENKYCNFSIGILSLVITFPQVHRVNHTFSQTMQTPKKLTLFDCKDPLLKSLLQKICWKGFSKQGHRVSTGIPNLQGRMWSLLKSVINVYFHHHPSSLYFHFSLILETKNKIKQNKSVFKTKSTLSPLVLIVVRNKITEFLWWGGEAAHVTLHKSVADEQHELHVLPTWRKKERSMNYK